MIVRVLDAITSSFNDLTHVR
ncbi:hypothetical protein ZOSMA_495G00020, partial [Zostera marina]